MFEGKKANWSLMSRGQLFWILVQDNWKTSWQTWWKPADDKKFVSDKHKATLRHIHVMEFEPIVLLAWETQVKPHITASEVAADWHELRVLFIHYAAIQWPH